MYTINNKHTNKTTITTAATTTQLKYLNQSPTHLVYALTIETSPTRYNSLHLLDKQTIHGASTQTAIITTGARQWSNPTTNLSRMSQREGTFEFLSICYCQETWLRPDPWVIPIYPVPDRGTPTQAITTAHCITQTALYVIIVISFFAIFYFFQLSNNQRIVSSCWLVLHAK